MPGKRKQPQKKPLIHKHGATVIALSQATPKFRKSMIKHAPPEVIHCVSECCHNVLKGNVPLTQPQKRQLHPNRQHLRLLADKRFPLYKKKQILNQKGGFLRILGLLAAPMIAKTISSSLAG